MKAGIPFKIGCMLAVLASPLVVAEPKIDSVQMTDQNQLLIKGENFGSGPNVVLYDTLENARTNGGSLAMSPEVGEWFHVRGSGGFVDGAWGEGTQALVVRDTGSGRVVNLDFGLRDKDGVHGLKHFQEVYYSYALRDLGEFPDGGRNSFANSSAAKDSWMMFGDRGDNTEYAVNELNERSGHDIAIPTWIGGMFAVTGNNTSMRPQFRQPELRNNWAFGEWVTYMFHAKLDPNNPYGNAEGFFAFLNKNTYARNDRSGNLMTDQSAQGVPYPYWDRIKFNAWIRKGDASVKRAMDNFYVAVGPNANARVLLTDAEKLSDSTRVLHLLPTRWSGDAITTDLPPMDEETVYFLHVINSDNEYSRSHMVCQICPPVPPGMFTVD